MSNVDEVRYADGNPMLYNTTTKIQNVEGGRVLTQTMSNVNVGKLIYVDGKPMVYNAITRRVNAEHHVVTQAEEHEQDSKMSSDAVEESQSEEVFSSYKCHSLPPSYKCLLHPGNIVVAGSLSAQNLPEASYNLLDSIPKGTIDECKLSDLQMEGILFACQRHQLILPDGNRAGFFLGDGTGVGKGRQIAGVILDNLCRGRKKHIWFSVSTDLRIDAQRDLNDIGCYTHVIDGCQQLDQKTKAFGLVSDFQEGILFSTYSTLVSIQQSRNSKKSRLDQLIKWCGDGFDGCLIFDECHKAKHFIPGKENKSAKVAVAVTMIQRLLPKARVIYCSATGVTDVKNMAFMERLGLWGIGTTFSYFDAFLDSLTRRGLGALEMLSIEMKAAGMYVSRGLSYKEAEFQTIEAKLTKEQIKVYDKAVSVWKELKRSLEIAINRTGNASPRIWTFFWASHQRFFKQMCMSMKVPEIVKLAKEALVNGYSVVIGLQTTGEASMESEIDQNDGDVCGFVSLTKEILKRFIYQYFPIERVVPGELSQVDEWCVQAKCLLSDFTEKIHLPSNPLDHMIDELGGPSCVAEMTGRKGFIGRYRKEDKLQYFPRGNTSIGVDSININERNAFMSGEKLIAFISDASSTGISLHADIRAGNQKRRVHITAELPWSADKAVQQLGRSHRSNQTSGPIYKLVTSNLGGERRFAAAVARRLQSLGAITKGDRRAATGANLTEFNFDTPYGHLSLKLMYDGILQNHICAGVAIDEIIKNNDLEGKYNLEEFNNTLKICLSDTGLLESNISGSVISDVNLRNIRKFLNRILGLEVVKQNLIFDYFSSCLDATTKAARREGKYNDGVTDICGNSIVMSGEPEIVFKDAQLGMSVTRHILVLVDRGIPFDQAMNKYNSNLKTENGFFRSKRDQYGKKLYLLAIQKTRSNHLYTVYRPNTGVSPFEEERNDLLHKYEKIKPSDAEVGWMKEYENTKDHCIHGNSCKYAEGCQIGSRITKVHLLTGRILSILPALEMVVAKFAHGLQLSREHRNLRVVRVELDNGKRLVGLRYPYILIHEVENYIKEQKVNNACLMGQTMPAIIEPQSCVNTKSITKALTKPTTIKTFFNTNKEKTENLQTNDLTLQTDSSNVETNSNSKDPHPNSQKDKKCTKKKILPTLGKKRKQSNIFNLMVSQNEKKKRRSCPICSKQFDDLNDESINAHIDGCLID